jgi:membrane protein
MSVWVRIIKRAAVDWYNDNIPTLGAALAYYTLFSLAPLLLIALAILGVVYGGSSAQQHVVEQLDKLVGKETGSAMGSLLLSAQQARTSGLTVVAIVVLLISACGAFVTLQDGIMAIWKHENHSYSGILQFLRVYLSAVIGVIATAIVLMASLILNTALYKVVHLLPAGSVAGEVWVWQAVDFVVSTAFIGLVCASIYRFMPEAPVTWRDVWAGALIAALLFNIGKHVFGLYLSHAGVTSVYGAAGSLVVVLLWVYYSSMIFFFGAEVTHAYAHEAGSMRRSQAFRRDTDAAQRGAASVVTH